jgi:hypothetical protein
MTEEFSLKKVAWDLVEVSQEAELSARGIIDEIFPQVYEASKRMSSRAISRFLTGNGVKLSAATIAKALREPQTHWIEFFEKIEPAALLFAKAHGLSAQAVVTDQNFLIYYEGKTPTIEVVSDEGAHDALEEYHGAIEILKAEWFSLSAQARECCLSYIDFSEEENGDASRAADDTKKSE